MDRDKYVCIYNEAQKMELPNIERECNISEWREIASIWAESHNLEFMIELLKHVPDDSLLVFVGTYWQVDFVKSNL
jgi:hypothetical protein